MTCPNGLTVDDARVTVVRDESIEVYSPGLFTFLAFSNCFIAIIIYYQRIQMYACIPIINIILGYPLEHGCTFALPLPHRYRI